MDYAGVADAAAAVVAGPPSYDLLEALAGAVASAALASDPRVDRGDRRPAQAAAAVGAGHRHRRGQGHPAAVTSSWSGPPTVRAFVGLGSNLGDRWAHLRRAVDQLRAGGRAPVTAVSSVYETEPVGGPEDQGPYLNLVVELAVAPDADPYRLSRSAAAWRPPPAGYGPPGGGRAPSTPTCCGSTG